MIIIALWHDYQAVHCRLGVAQLGQHARQSVSTTVEAEGVRL